jgi:integrase
LREAVEFFIRRNPASLEQRTVRQVVDELIDQKTKGGRGDVYLKDLTGRLGKFADAFQMNIGQVTGPLMEKYLSSLAIARRTKMNHLRLIVGLFKFAVRKKYLAKDALDELDAVEKLDAELTEIEIFSPLELRGMLAAARGEIVPWLAIAAFAGLRHAELQRLDWSEVNLAERHIEVPAVKSKTASRRLVPMPDNLFAWLEPYRRETGPVTGFANMAKQIAWLISDMNEALKKQAVEAGHDPKNVRKFVWKRNALRHSFISYRLAVLKDVAAVALEAGNSPTMIFRNYRALVTENEGKAWFSIAPQAAMNVVPMSEGLAKYG